MSLTNFIHDCCLISFSFTHLNSSVINSSEWYLELIQFEHISNKNIGKIQFSFILMTLIYAFIFDRFETTNGKMKGSKGRIKTGHSINN